MLEALGFGVEMIFAIGIYVFFQERKPYFALKLVLCLGAMFIICTPYQVFLAGWLVLYVLLVYLWSLLAIKLCFKLSWAETLVCWIAGCATQFISSQAYFLVSGVLSLGCHAFPIQVCITLGTYCVCALVFGRRLHKEQIEIYSDNRVLMMALTVWIIVDLACNYGRMPVRNWQTP